MIAGYHWFTDWGRDTMISLEGLTLTTRPLPRGRLHPADVRPLRPRRPDPEHVPRRRARRAVSHRRRDAVVLPRRGPLRAASPAIPRRCGSCCRRLDDIVEHHLEGTRFGIGVDPADGLLRQGAEGYQLTWMDAKVDDWVVTPRRGKAVEINALWYNALRLLDGVDARVSAVAGPISIWQRHAGACARVVQPTVLVRRGRLSVRRRRRRARATIPRAGRTRCSRSRSTPGARRARWEPVLNVVRERLLTPVGLRSLAPGHPDYKAKYYGDLRARDAAYHQGTVWAWLIGPFVDAWLKVHPDDRAGARQLLDGFERAPERGVRRLDQRDLRRRAAVHAARLRRAGVERGGGPAVPREDRRLRAQPARRETA